MKKVILAAPEAIQAAGCEPVQTTEELERVEQAAAGLGEALDELREALEKLRETLGGGSP